MYWVNGVPVSSYRLYDYTLGEGAVYNYSVGLARLKLRFFYITLFGILISGGFRGVSEVSIETPFG